MFKVENSFTFFYFCAISFPEVTILLVSTKETSQRVSVTADRNALALGTRLIFAEFISFKSRAARALLAHVQMTKQINQTASQKN